MVTKVEYERGAYWQFPTSPQRIPILVTIANAAIFAVLHFIPILLPLLFMTGLVLTFVRARTNSIVPGILIHGLSNALFVLGIYATSSGQAS